MKRMDSRFTFPIVCATIGFAGCVAIAKPERQELIGSWRVSASQPAARIEFRADQTCSADSAFATFVAACNSRSTGPALAVRTCHWGVEGTDGTDEVQVVLDSTRGFLALRMRAERLLGPGVLQLNGTCVDHTRYRLAP